VSLLTTLGNEDELRPGFLKPGNPNLTLWLDASKLESLTFAIGQKISQWDDFSGNGNHAFQATSTNQAQLGTMQNGYPCLLWSATNYMEAPNTIDPGNGALSAFVVYNRSSGNNQSLLSQVQTTGSGRTWLNILPTNTGKNNSFLGGINTTASSALSLNDTHLVDLVLNGTNLTMYEDGVSSFSATVTGEACTGNIVIGSTRIFTESHIGKISEVILYDKAISLKERHLLQNYLLKKWGIKKNV